MIKIADLTQHIVYQGELPPHNEYGGYQYVLAGNGLFLRAQNRFVEATLLLRGADVRGLPAMQPDLRLKQRLPAFFLTNIIAHARRYLNQEIVYQVTAQERLRLHAVAFGSKTAAVFDDIAPSDNIIFEAHSHNTMSAFFSSTDNQYEQHFRWYAVVGRLDRERPSVALRLGLYGYHFPVPVRVLFPDLDKASVVEGKDYED